MLHWLLILATPLFFLGGIGSLILKPNKQIRKIDDLTNYNWQTVLNHLLLMQAITLGVVSAGVAIATVTDLEFNLFGACIALAWVIPSAVNKILWSNMQQTANWTALA
jgi:ABC-type sugar transport system permease subunit